MTNESTNFSRRQTIGGSRIGGKVALAIYSFGSPYGHERADLQIHSAAADGAATVWLSDSLAELQNGAQAIAAPGDLGNPSNLQPIILGAAGTVPYSGLTITSVERMYMLVITAADNIHVYVTYTWEKEAVRLDFYNAVFKTQEAAGRIVAAAEEVSRQTSWLDKLRQIPAPWSMPGTGQASNKPPRQLPTTLYQMNQAARMSPGEPDIPRSKRDRLTRG